MALSRPIAIELFLVQTSGPWHRPGSPVLYCWFQALHLPGTAHEGGSIISVLSRGRDGQTWREFNRPVTIDRSREILADLEAIGLPTRTPEVSGVLDTSDGWNRVHFRVRLPGEARSVEIDMHSSGFEGKDAEALRALFRRLFTLAEFADFSSVIYG